MTSSRTIHTFLSLMVVVSRVKATPIVNGRSKPVEPSLGTYPFHVNLLQLINHHKNYHSFCGGSLIHPRWVLTAAHCIQEDRHSRAFKPGEIYAALGSIHTNGKNAQIVKVSRTHIHPTYLRTDRNDLGLLKLKKEANLGTNVKLIQLHVNNNESLLKKTAYLTGFGVINDKRENPRRLRRATLHISDNDKCLGKSKNRNIEICGVSTLAEGKACDGDSGGPLFIVKNGKRIQVGITSYLSRSWRCELSNNYSVYTRVSAYISWISKVTGINFAKYNQN